eukprot:SAG11_NODE_26_length_23420_cov_40.459886_14_plen_85_part_00
MNSAAVQAGNTQKEARARAALAKAQAVVQEVTAEERGNVEEAFRNTKEAAAVAYLRVPADIVINNSLGQPPETLALLFEKCQTY